MLKDYICNISVKILRSETPEKIRMMVVVVVFVVIIKENKATSE
jgi:hypothetical protein